MCVVVAELLGVCCLGGGDLSGLLAGSGSDGLVVRLGAGLVSSGLVGSGGLDGGSFVSCGVIDLCGVSRLLDGSLEELLLPVGERLSVARLGVVLLLQALCRCVRDDAGEQRDGADGVVVAGDRVLEVV